MTRSSNFARDPILQSLKQTAQRASIASIATANTSAESQHMTKMIMRANGVLWLSRSLQQTPIPAHPSGVGDWFHDFPAAANQSRINLGTDLLSFVNSHLHGAFLPLLHPLVTDACREPGHEPAEVSLLRHLLSWYQHNIPCRVTQSQCLDKLTNIGVRQHRESMISTAAYPGRCWPRGLVRRSTLPWRICAHRLARREGSPSPLSMLVAARNMITTSVGFAFMLQSIK